MFFRIIIFLFFFVKFSFSTNLLEERILKYNNIKTEKKETLKIDSAKIFLPLKKFNNLKTINFQKIIIKKRHKEQSYTIFLILLVFMVIASILKFSFLNSFNKLFTNFFTFKFKIIEDYDTTIITFFIFLYSISMCYIVHLVSSLLYKNNIIDFNIIIIFGLFFCFKFLVNNFIFYVFNLSDFRKKYNYINSEFFVLISMSLLPLFIFFNISNNFINKRLFIFILLVTIVFIVFKQIKLVFNNGKLLYNNILNTILYIFAIDILPILMILKITKAIN